jgi:hypothetical protein
MKETKKIKRKGGPRPGTPSPLKGRPSPLRGRLYPHLWTSGPDPDHHRLWRKFLVAKNQAKYWHQEWTVSWEAYRDIMLPHINNMGRKKDSWNLVRKDRNLPWTELNVIAAQRKTVVEMKKAGHRTYLPEHELARRREAMIKYKQRGYTGKRYKRYDNND